MSGTVIETFTALLWKTIHSFFPVFSLLQREHDFNLHECCDVLEYKNLWYSEIHPIKRNMNSKPNIGLLWWSKSKESAWRIPWTEEPGRLQSTGLQRVGHDWATNTFTFTFSNPASWAPPPCFSHQSGSEREGRVNCNSCLWVSWLTWETAKTRMAPQACSITLTASSQKENPLYEIPPFKKSVTKAARHTGVVECGHSNQRASTEPLPTAISIKLTKF